MRDVTHSYVIWNTTHWKHDAIIHMWCDSFVWRYSLGILHLGVHTATHCKTLQYTPTHSRAHCNNPTTKNRTHYYPARSLAPYAKHIATHSNSLQHTPTVSHWKYDTLNSTISGTFCSRRRCITRRVSCICVPYISYTLLRISSENPSWGCGLMQELWSHQWHGWVLEQSFVVCNVLYPVIYFKSLVPTVYVWEDWGQRWAVACLHNTSMLSSEDFPKCLCCVLSILWCTVGACLDVDIVERSTPCRFCLVLIRCGRNPDLVL